MRVKKETATERRIAREIETQHGQVLTNTEYCVRLPAGPHLAKIPSRGGMRIGAPSKLKLSGRVVSAGIQWWRITSKDELVDAGFERVSEDELKRRFDC